MDVETTMDNEKQQLLECIRRNVIGKSCAFSGPFGIRKILYCDYIASGKPLEFIENFINEHVLPMYSNTHTTTSVTALQMTLFRQEARDIIRNSVRASEHDAVIFTGDGVTGAVHKLIKALNLENPPVVFCGPFEHHSNLLPWREIAAHVVRISENTDGSVNLSHLESALKEWENQGLPLIGCFSAASNVTGQLSDTVAISLLLHKYNALSVWDYATAAPYIAIDMHPVTAGGDASKDAIFISPHKFVGGVGTPGVLVAAKRLFKSSVPSNCGGGSVFFVSESSHRFLKDEETREEGGTPNIIGAIRAGLAFKLKDDIGSETIMERENEIYNRVMKQWKEIQNLEVLGNTATNYQKERLAIFSFLIRHPGSGLYLHYSFIAALLNDLFGIQARGGCACAGPYAQDLLGISPDYVKRFERALIEDSRLDRRHLRRFKEYSPHEVLRPGFVRLSLPYFMTDEEVDFVVNAVKLIADAGWTMLPNYMFNPETGEWKNIKDKVFKGRKWLGHVNFTPSGISFKEPKMDDTNGKFPANWSECLEIASGIFGKITKSPIQFLPDQDSMFDRSVEDLRWFLTPSEAQSWLSKLQGRQKLTLPIRSPSFEVRKAVRELTEEEIKDRVAVSAALRQKITTILRKNTTIEQDITNATNDLSKQMVEKINTNKSQSENTTESPETPSGTSSDQKVCNLNGSDIKSYKDVSRTNATNDDKRSTLQVRFIPPPKRLFKLTAQAIEEFKMINNGDKVLVCLSGGKDSLSLLHTLHQYQFYIKKQGINFQLGAVTIDPKTASYDPSPMIPYLATLGLPYFYEVQNILDQALALPEVTSICAFCSRMKRGRLYHCARREGWNVLAMGQHLDDLAESFLMSTFQNGLLRTIKANYKVTEGDLRVIRPFVYVREKDTRDFAENSNLPVIPENCPACFEAPKERHRMKQLLASQEIIHPKLFYNLKEALKPLMSKNETGMESGMLVMDTVDFDGED